MLDSLSQAKYKLTAIISLILFVVLTYIVRFKNQFLFELNVPLHEHLSYSSIASYSGLWKSVTLLGGPIFLSLITLVAIVYFWHKKNIVDVVLYAFSMIGGFAVVGLLKYYTASDRPLFLTAIEQTYSYPSGHTALSAIFLLITGFVYAKDKNHKHQKTIFWIGAWVSASIAFSRLFLGEHWVSDVLGGYLLAFAWSFGCIYYIDIKNKPKSISAEEKTAIAH